MMYQFNNFYQKIALKSISLELDSLVERVSNINGRYGYHFFLILGRDVNFTLEGDIFNVNRGDILFVRGRDNLDHDIQQTEQAKNTNYRINKKIISNESKDSLLGFLPIDSASESLFFSRFPKHFVTSRGFRFNTSNLLLFKCLERQLIFGDKVEVEVIQRLVDLLINLALKDHYKESSEISEGLFALYRHPRLSKAVELIQNNPEKDWKTSHLAKAACLSRSSFCNKFKEVSGVTVFEFITWFRMRQAWNSLCQGESVGVVSENVGYQSEPSFNRAFKKTFGETAATVRRRHMN